MIFYPQPTAGAKQKAPSQGAAGFPGQAVDRKQKKTAARGVRKSPKNQKMIARLEKILLFLADSFGISCDVEKPEKITKKRGTGLLFNVDASGRRYAEAVTGDFYNVGGMWYFIHKKPEIKRGGYVLSAAAYGARVAGFGLYKTAKEAISWITENGISQKLLNPPAEGRARAAEMRARFLEAVENSGLSWVIDLNPAFFEDFIKAPAETPAEAAEMPQNATESTTAAECTTEAEKAAEKAENAPTECATPAEDPAEAKKPVYIYGMRLRGYSIGCQPAGVIERRDDPNGRYYDIIVYESPLTADEMRAYSLDDLTDRQTADTARPAAVSAAPTEAARPADNQPTDTPAGITTDRKPTTAARIDRRTRHKPHISPKTARGYISTIDGTKALKRAKYTPTMARPTPPISIGLQKMDFPGLKKVCFVQKRKIAGFSVKNRFGFCTGISPPGGYQKISL